MLVFRHFRQIRLLAILIVAFLGFGAVPLAAALTPNAAARHIDWLGREATRLLSASGTSVAAREAAVGRLIRQGFQIDFIARFALGRAWRSATPEQRGEYQRLFTLYVVKTYARRLGGYSGETLRVTGVRKAGRRDMLVDSVIERANNQPIRIGWRLREFAGQPKIIDVTVEGVSMAVTQRQEFATVLRNGGMNGLLQLLRARTQRLGVQAR